MFTGQSAEGPFSARFGRGVKNLQIRLSDFLKYENAHGRTVILSFPEDIDVKKFVAQALYNTPPAYLVRPDDPEIIVHSTTLAAWENIQSSGMLKAASLLGFNKGQTGNPQELSEIERYYQTEPSEYADYIMFGGMDSTEPEMVLASKRAGRFMLDQNEPYEPGVRLYLNNHRIISDGLGTRDGLHLIKVFELLPLKPYLLEAIGAGEADPENKIKKWTPLTFMEKTNKVFKNSVLIDY